MGFDSIWHWGLLLIIVILVFGTKKLGNIGSDLGNAVRGFKKAMHGDEEAKAKEAEATKEQLRADPPPAAPASTQEQRDSHESK